MKYFPLFSLNRTTVRNLLELNRNPAIPLPAPPTLTLGIYTPRSVEFVDWKVGGGARSVMLLHYEYCPALVAPPLTCHSIYKHSPLTPAVMKLCQVQILKPAGPVVITRSFIKDIDWFYTLFQGPKSKNCIKYWFFFSLLRNSKTLLRGSFLY